jgi:hypothetical protein
LYSTCIFCHSSLGKNEAVEHFPVGRRLAFDGSKGRLWAVCPKCGRWNLTPIEERWEAIEECEKQFRGTLLRSSTDQIGLGRVKEGTDLIRIGEPLRPEFAAWRYEKNFRRRRNQTYAMIGISAGVTIGLSLLGGTVVGTFGPLLAALKWQMAKRNELGHAQRFIRQSVERKFGQKAKEVYVRIISSSDDNGWALRFAFEGKFLDFHGKDALHAAHIVAPAINSAGASPSAVKDAVNEIERSGSPEALFKRVLKTGEDKGWHYTPLNDYPEAQRLAFEMAAHEETERAAIEGELAQLETDWREAEEIAAIADNLFLPKAVTDFIDRHRPRP